MTPELARALAALPHGPEFRFLDRLVELEPGRRGVAEYTLRGDEAFLRGHFPGEPLMPGVLLLEAAAQLAGVVAQSDPARPPLPGLKLTAVRQAKITGTARPGETLTVRAEVVGRLGRLVQARAGVSAGGVEILVGELTLSGAADEPG
jgi:3-hydroxyacyl-[acyl-carrier-protein] dehydratase